MSDAKIIQAAKDFVKKWENKGNEDQDTNTFWLELLEKVYGVSNNYDFIEFQKKSLLDSTKRIDAYIAETGVLIEQKSFDISLDTKIKQSDGKFLTPFQQAQRYIGGMNKTEYPSWIVTCNFQEFWIYNLNELKEKPQKVLLKNLPKEYHRLQFLCDVKTAAVRKEAKLNKDAGKLVDKLYTAIRRKYGHSPSKREQHTLNVLCVRLFFCLYAEDAGVFEYNQFYNYLASYNKDNVRDALIALFKVLNQKKEERDKFLNPKLAAFPYVNGGLFKDANYDFPQFDAEIVNLILEDCSAGFDWSEISPTIFGALFESTLNPETRRKGGMHYTSIENIHKVIDPLFLDELKNEFSKIKEIPNNKKMQTALIDFQNKLASLKFLDPACGSGNFLTETYICLRKMENEIISLLNKGESVLMAEENPIKVSISQFYGIEIHDFAVNVAKTALWIAESQMMKKTEGIVHMDLDFLPLKTNAYIVEGNALRMDWNKVIPANELNYIMGNPPFVGHQWRSKEQQADMDIAFEGFEIYGKLDYVAAWYKKSADYMQHTNIKCAFVSTNSICQGESVAVMWKPLFEKLHLEIIFAWRTFVWNSESNDQAAVHCVIIGFTCFRYTGTKYIFVNDGVSKVNNINGYLLDAPNLFVKNRSVALTADLPTIIKGSQPTDGGNLLLTTEEKEQLVKDYPQVKRFIKVFIGADEFINNKKRYCLWLKDIAPSEYRNITPIMERLKKVAEMRRNSPTKSVQRDAETPMLFTQIRQPNTNYLIVPRVSSENRRYIPIGYMDKDVISSDSNYIIPLADIYYFGILVSNVHNAWMRAMAGRLKSDYRYSPAVYNNFPWPNPPCPPLQKGASKSAETITPPLQKGVSKSAETITPPLQKGVSKSAETITPPFLKGEAEGGGFAKQKAKIEETAQGILDARAKYPDSSLADLYDELTMPADLRKAHQANDKAVMEAYGFDYRTMTESECVAELMKMYQKLVENPLSAT